MAPDRVTREDIATAQWFSAVHYNMGRAGYGYGYKSKQIPRVQFINKTYRPAKDWPDGKQEQEWHVDGAKVDTIALDRETHSFRSDYAKVIEALDKPPAIDEDEARILAMVPIDFVDATELREELAGEPAPRAIHYGKDAHGRVHRWLDRLADRGLIEYGRKNWEPGEGNDIVPDHLRWSPTLRRRPGAPEPIILPKPQEGASP